MFGERVYSSSTIPPDYSELSVPALQAGIGVTPDSVVLQGGVELLQW